MRLFAPDPRRSSEEARRNHAVIALVIARAIGAPEGLALELGSGSGEHVLAWSRRFPRLRWQPSDPDPVQRASVAAWCARAPSVRAPIALDAAQAPWPVEGPITLIVAVHLLHLAPASALVTIAAESRRLLAPGGALVLHGPFLDDAGRAASERMRLLHERRLAEGGAGLPSRRALLEAAAREGLSPLEEHGYDGDQLTIALGRRA